MAKIAFRTADGRLVTFSSAGSRRGKRNPAKRATVKRTAKCKVKRTVKRAKSPCKIVKFRKGPAVRFCRKAGSDKARKTRAGKSLYKKNGLAAFAFVKGKALKGAALTGKKSGQVFKKGGNTYRLVSYRSKTGKSVRYALRVRATAKR